MERSIKPVAYIHTDFGEKFGIPRQSTLVRELTGVITFTEEFKDPAAIRGMEEYSHLWLLWDFSQSKWDEKSLTVFPPRLGGKIKRGVFACRTPFRPNGIGLSAVKIEKIVSDGPDGPEIHVSGVDMLDGTPIFDIKPYIPYSDNIPDAKGGFGQANKDFRVEVDFPGKFLEMLPADKRNAAVRVLELDPRAAYNKAPDHVFGMNFAGYDIRFTAQKCESADGKEYDRLVVCDVKKADEGLKKIK